jgi:phosphate butyryltransferase
MNRQPIHSSDELIARAVAIANEGRKKTVAVAAAQDADVIDAVVQASAEGFLNGVLCGDQQAIESLAAAHDLDLSALEIVNFEDVGEAAHAAAKLASEGQADAIMKGFLPTSALLKTVLDRRYNLRGKNTLSHCAVLDIPGYHKLLNFTDGGMVVKPDQETKFQILENAVLVARALDLSPVKIAISAATHVQSERVPHTGSDVAYIIPQAESRLHDIAIQGPLPIDLATSATSAQIYGVTGPVVGEADIFLVDSIEECNIVCKALINFAEAVFAGVIVGARVPVSLVSRTDTVKNKKSSLALACVLADYYTRARIFDEEGRS